MKTTVTEPFFSKSSGVGSIRWRADLLPDALQAYVLDMKYQPELPARWYLFALVSDGTSLTIRVHVLAGAEVEAAPLERDELLLSLHNPPVIAAQTNTDDVYVALERFERAVANVMHNLLTPHRSVEKYWTRLATTDGTDLYKA